MTAQEQACPLTKGEQILVAVDGSVYSDYAVDQAISLGGMCNSTIHLLSVVDLYPEQMDSPPPLPTRCPRKPTAIWSAAKKKWTRPQSHAKQSCELVETHPS